MTKKTLARLTLLLAAIAGAGAVPVRAQEPAGPAGHWEGAIQAPDQNLAIAVDLFAEADGKWAGAISIATQNVKGLPLGDVSVKGDAVAFSMKGVPGAPTFAGRLSKDRKSIAGDLSQGGATMPFTLAWKGEAVRPAKPASTAIDSSLEGTWEGTLDAGGTRLRLVLKLSNQGGKGAATIVSVDQGGAEIPATSVAQAGSRLKLDVSAIAAAFEGEVKEGQLAGTWSQGGGSLPLVFKRVP
jgi:hypothetical protein